MNRDPYIIHLNIALSMVVPLYFGVEKATCFKWLQNGDLLRSPDEPDRLKESWRRPENEVSNHPRSSPFRLDNWAGIGIPAYIYIYISLSG